MKHGFTRHWASIACIVTCSLVAHASLVLAHSTQGKLIEQVVGTWTGTSTCVGNRPACKNETVVYRFVPIEGQPAKARLLADKVIDGKRVPMGAIDFDVDQEKQTLRGEFTRGQTHGIWSFTVVGGSIAGTLVILPDRSIARDVKVHRVSEADVPAAPALDEYSE